MKLELRVNRRKVTSAREIERELGKAAEQAIEDSLRKAAGPGVRLRKVRDGFVVEGTTQNIGRLADRLK